jgi:YHS domain-containing protein
MTVDPATGPATLTYAGTTHYFCSTGCRDTFADDIHPTHRPPART